MSGFAHRTPPPPRRVDYAGASGPAGSMIDPGALVRHLSGWVFVRFALGLALFGLLPRLETAYQKAPVELPAVTQAMLSVSRWVQQYWWMLLPVPIIHSLTIAYLYPSAGRGARRTYRLVITLIVCAAFAATILAMFLPYVALLQSLAGTNP